MWNQRKRWGVVIAAILLAVVLTGPDVYAASDETSADAAAVPIGNGARMVTEEGYLKLHPPVVYNPLTGIEGYNEAAVGKRPIALVVENDPKARPQWGIDDPEKSPDIILEGEMEGGETRTLWFYADMNSLPSQVGPLRSARPPYVRFSELFDAIFVHCGFSRTTWDYTGADTVFEEDQVDHIDMLHYDNATGVFDRDYTRTSMLEHTAFLRGERVADTVAAFGFRTDADLSHYTVFEFRRNEEPDEPEAFAGLAGAANAAVAAYLAPPEEPEEPAGTPCRTIDCTFSSATDTRHFEYSEADGMYHTQDYYTDVARTNVLILFDTTQYISKADYWGAGQEELYCDYLFTGGTGKLASAGKVEDITWAVENGKIVLRNQDGEPALLTPGKTWIGWCSGNKGGSATTAE